MSSLYKHLEFSNPAKQIRLLRLEPSPTGTDEYAFSLEVHDFQENSRPSYIAISYTWGLPIPKLPVVINGLRMQLQFNCWYALWQMRYHGYPSDVNFWMDSLCINQGNDEEKGHQVAMMGDIYSSASLVAASLGSGESLGNVRKVLASRSDYEIGKLRERFDRLPYFDRVWIIQEIVLAKDIAIFYGLERLSWSEFVHIVNPIKTKARASQIECADSSDTSPTCGNRINNSMIHERFEGMSISTQLCDHRSQIAKTSTIMELIAKYRTAEASVAADKIYALLSLLPQSDPIRQNLPVIYGQSTLFPLFRDLIKLMYIYYEDERGGAKLTALGLIRDAFGISGLDEEVIDFLGSQACIPSSVWSFHQESAHLPIFNVAELYEEDAKDVDEYHIKVKTDPTEPVDIVKKLGLFEHGGQWDQEYYGTESLHGRDGNRTHLKLHIPPQLKSLRTLYSVEEKQPHQMEFDFARGPPYPSPDTNEDFLVNSDVRAGDLIAYLGWESNDFKTEDQWGFAHVVLRRSIVLDEIKDEDRDVPLEEETSRSRAEILVDTRMMLLVKDYGERIGYSD
ncbi:Heterokaryon incompatibility protein 6, OR allele [Colletotrichum viniferum]|nr:Heterokaryon incompatibility protein 6, OR allele [Colletotrichum viniferum]